MVNLSVMISFVASQIKGALNNLIGKKKCFEKFYIYFGVLATIHYWVWIWITCDIINASYT